MADDPKLRDGLEKAAVAKRLGVGPTNEVEQELADLLTSKLPAYKMRQFERKGEMERHPMFRTGSLTPQKFRDEETPWHFIERIAPEMRDKATAIHFGPDRPNLEDLLDARVRNLSMSGTNRAGAYSPRTGQISLNPDYGYYQEHRNDPRDPPETNRGVKAAFDYLNRENQGELDATVAHEMAHSVGFGHDRDTYNIEGLMRMAREYQRQQKR